MLSVGWIRQPTLNENGGVFVRKFLWLPLRRADVMRSRDGTRGQETASKTTLLQPGRKFHTTLNTVR